MAHYAFLNENNIVTEVIVGIDETETIEGLDPETWYGNFRGQTCKRTSYNNNIRKTQLNKKNKILELIPEIRKYCSFSTIIGASEPTKAKRPYLSIIRQLTKSKYKLNSYDYRIKQDGKEDIRTKKYIFELYT